ncbi:MAG TPA: EamA family transporter [bacterium]
MPRQTTTDAAALGLFALLCLMWGSGWLALKIGVTALPPLLFASSRFLGASAALLAMLLMLGRLRGLLALPWRAALPGALLMFAANYGLMAWGVTRAASGLSAVVNLATVPLAMAVFGRIYGVARLTGRTLAGLALGSVGLALLLLPPVFAKPGVGDLGPATALGLLAIAGGASCYAWGSVLTRRHVNLGHVPALELSTYQALVGGAVLLAASALAEPWADLGAALEPTRLGGWGFLVTVTVVSSPVYLALLARWAPSRVAAYAYVCPVIAVAEGVLLGGEVLTLAQAAAALVLGLSAWLVLGTAPDAAPRVEPAAPSAQPLS